MNAFDEKIKKLVTKHFKPHELTMEQYDEYQLNGVIVSKKFEGLDHFDRQKQVWKVLRKNLTKAEQRKILGFLAYTPGEYEAYNAPA
jgi:stress-induced morphogen